MDGKRKQSVIIKYYLAQVTSTPGFIWPIYLVYALSQGLSYAEVGVVGTVQAVIVIAGEVPTGYVGDRIGRRNSLIIGTGLLVIATAGFVFASGLASFALVFGIWALGTAFTSGSNSAWLYDILQETLDEDQFTHVRGRGASFRQWGMALMMIAGGYMYSINHVYPFVGAAASNVVALFVMSTMRKNERYDNEEGNTPFSVQESLQTVRRLVTNSDISVFVFYMAGFYGVINLVDIFIQPMAVELFRNQFRSTMLNQGIPSEATLGFLYAGFTVVSGAVSYNAGRIHDTLGTSTSIVGITLCTTILFVIPTFLPIMAFPMFFGMKMAKSALSPIEKQYINDQVGSVGRATALSIVSMIYATVAIPFRIAGGVLADATTPFVSVAVAGGAFLILGSLAYGLTTIVVCPTEKCVSSG